MNRAMWLGAAAGAAMLIPGSATAAEGDAGTAGAATPSMSLRVANVLPDGQRSVVLSGEAFRAIGRMDSSAAGERVRVTIFRNGRSVDSVSPTVRPSGRFVANFRVRRTGTLQVSAVHEATATLGRATAEAGPVEVVAASIGYGSRGPLVRVLQAELSRQRYVISRTGVYDAATGRAVRAFRSVNRMRKLTIPNRAMLELVFQRKGAFRLRYPGHGKHVEADITRQVLVLANRGRVERVYITTPGAPSTPTIRGRFRFRWKDPGYNSLGMLHSAYFGFGGYAIHGYVSVPPYHASHGCLRVPLVNARGIYDWIRVGDTIDVWR